MTNLSNSTQEVWKDIQGYEGLYQASNLGRIRSMYSNKILKLGITNSGYYSITLSKNKAQKTICVHRIIAFAFIGNPPLANMEVNHKNGNKLDNRENNLEWLTKSENQLHAIKLGYATPFKNREDYSRAKKVIQLKDNIIINTFESTSQAGKITGFERTAIAACARGKLKTAYGYNWKYAS